MLQVALVASGIVLARSLGPAGRGDLAVVLVLPEVALQLAGVGLPSAVAYYVARNRSAVWPITRQLMPVAALQILLTGGLLLALTELFLGAKDDATQVAGLLTFIGVPLLVTQYYAIHILQGLGELRWFNAFKVANPAVFSVGLGLGLFGGLTVVTCTVIWLAGRIAVTFAVAIVLLARIRRVNLHRASEGPVPTRGEIIRFAIAGFLAQVSPVETFRVDTLVVTGLFPSQVVGYYTVALSISNAPRFIADALVAVAYPQIAAQEPAAARASTKRYMIAATVACGGTSIALALASPYIIPLLFGKSFAPAVGIAVILVIGAGVISLRRVGTDCLRATGRPGATTGIEALSLLVLATGFVLLGPWQQGRGVATALIVSAATGLFLTLRSLRKAGRGKQG